MRHVTSGSVVMGLATDGQWVGRPTYEESLRTTGWLATGLLISSASELEPWSPSRAHRAESPGLQSG